MLKPNWIRALRLAWRSPRAGVRQARRRRLCGGYYTETLEDRTLLSSAVPALVGGIQAAPPNDLSITAINQTVDAVMVIDSITITGSTGAGVDITLDNLSGLKTLIFDSIVVSDNAAQGVNINIADTDFDNLIIESIQVAGNAQGGVSITFDNVNLKHLTIFESSIDGVRIVSNNSFIETATINENTISGNTSGDGIFVNLTNTPVPQLTIDDNPAVNANSGNGINVNLNNAPIADLSINDNMVNGNTGSSGVIVNSTDSNVEGQITGNQVSNNSGGGLTFTATASPAFVTANGGPLTFDFQSINPLTGRSNGINNNTISNNTGGSGILAALPKDTRFEANIFANTVSNNAGFGFSVDAINGGYNVMLGGSAVNPATGAFTQSNLFSNNRGAAISFLMRDTSGTDLVKNPNHFEIRNNVITNTLDDTNANSAYIGDGIHVQLSTTNLLVNATAALTNPIIDGNFIGTDRAGATGGGNAGRGISINMQDDTQISDLQITNNTVNNNDGTAVQILRLDDSIFSNLLDVQTDPNAGPLSRAVHITGNTIRNNGLNPTGPVPKPESIPNTGDGIDITIRNGAVTLQTFLIDQNSIMENFRGIHFEGGADGRLVADVTRNLIDRNRNDGILVTEEVNSATDFRRVSGTWVKNTITNNAGHGIQLNGATGGLDALAIGLEGVDPLDGRNRGNLINSNGLDGIEINGSGSSWIINNEIAHNGTGGVDINALGITNPTVSLIHNAIIDNRGDGLEIGNGSITFVNVTALGNTIKLNDGRGVDILNRDRGTLVVKFGDGTIDGRNLIVENLLEGFYAVNTASATQAQDVPSTDPLAADGALFNAPDLILDLDNNFIKQNGKNAGLEGAGLILRVGTSNAGTSATSVGPGLGTETGTFGNGRVNARVVNNSFEGNFGVDVFIESFVSTVDVPTTSGTWSDTMFQVDSGFRRDPLARLNLVFSGNDGNSLDVTRTGAFYDNAEGTFKSRTNGRTAPDPNGPVDSGTRRRNAQRLAARDEDINNNGVLDFGEDTNNNGIIDRVSPQTGADGGQFLFDGIGQSTFRIAAGFDTIDGIPNDGQDFTNGDGFAVDAGPVLDFTLGSSLSAATSNARGELYPGSILGEIPYGWGIWTPNNNGDSFPDPFQDVAPFQPTP